MNLTNVDICQLLDEFGIDYQDTGKNISEACVGVCCPFCGDDGYHLGIFRDHKNWTCWKCRRSGMLPQLLWELGRITQADLDAAIRPTPREVPTSLTEHIKALFTKKDSIIEKRNPLVEIEIPGVEISHARVSLYPELLDFLALRNISVDTCVRYKACFCNSGKFANRLIIPVYRFGVPVGFQARDITGMAEPKYLIPWGVKLNHYLYNIEECKTDTILLLEGPLDVWRMGSGSACTFGTHLTVQQKAVLSEMKHIRNAIIVWDSDAINKAPRMAKELADIMDAVRIVRLPFGQDPDSLGRERTLEFIGEYTDDAARRAL